MCPESLKKKTQNTHHRFQEHHSKNSWPSLHSGSRKTITGSKSNFDAWTERCNFNLPTYCNCGALAILWHTSSKQLRSVDEVKSTYHTKISIYLIIPSTNWTVQPSPTPTKNTHMTTRAQMVVLFNDKFTIQSNIAIWFTFTFNLTRNIVFPCGI